MAIQGDPRAPASPASLATSAASVVMARASPLHWVLARYGCDERQVRVHLDVTGGTDQERRPGPVDRVPGGREPAGRDR